ncbi:MAG: rhomboid family intramembrane serine protease [Phycisphaerales bacterium]|nr:rhomboid family intramembrane serine protease [Phycisphaerales bacterium]
MIPLGTDRGLSRPTVVNHLLIAANVAVFCAVAIAGIRSERGQEGISPILDRWCLLPEFTQPWRLVTYAFLHDMSSLWHLLGNMLFLWVFGPNVEDRFGRIGYLAFYLAAAAGAGAGHILVSDAPAIGASGAIAGVTGAYMVLFPRTQVRVLFFFFLIGIIHMSALWFVSLSVLLNIIGAASHRGSQVAYGAHLFGYAFGFSIALALLASGLLKSETFDLFHLFRQARRRAEIREAYREQHQRTDTPFASKEAPKGMEPEISELAKPVAEARAEVGRLLAIGQVAEASGAYKSLVEKYGLIAGAGTLSRGQQLDLANHFFQRQDFSSAVAAYERFIEAYPRDREAPHVRLILAVIAGRYLHQAPRAKALLAEAIPALRDAEDVAIANDLLAELDGTPASNPS